MGWRGRMLSLVWFKRDLRVIDHPALALAASQGRVLPVYITEPALWALPDASARQWDFATECVTELRRDLAALGQPLILRDGDAVEVLARLHTKHKFDQIVSHDEPGDGWAMARDQRVRAWAQGKGLPWIEVPQSRGDGPQRRAFLAQPLAEVTALDPVTEGTGALPSARSLKLAEDRCPYRQKGGRAAAVVALDGFMAGRAQSYRGATTAPVSSERATSRLSPYLSWGVLSVREVVQRAAQEKDARRGQVAWGVSLRSFEKSLLRRDAARAGAAAFEGALEPASARLSAWQAGETGLPFVDACLRYVQVTGWLEARSRALIAGFGVHHLRLHAEAVGNSLARLSTDYDWVIHTQAMAQIAAGRVPDPVAQGRKLDPDGGFIRRWIPELTRVPADYLHTPWLWPQARVVLNGRYPEPMVDPASAGRAAKARQPITLRQTTPLRRRVAAGQLTLDL